MSPEQIAKLHEMYSRFSEVQDFRSLLKFMIMHVNEEYRDDLRTLNGLLEVIA